MNVSRPFFSIQKISVSFFLKKIKPILENKEIRKNDLFELLEIEKKLFDKWIKIGIENDKIIKLTRPVRYIWSKQVSLFDKK